MKAPPRPVKSLSSSSVTATSGFRDAYAWSDKEKQILRDLRAKDTSWAVVAKTLNRNYNACRQQYAFMLGEEALEKEDIEKQSKCNRCHRARPGQDFFDCQNMPRAHCKVCVKKVIFEEARKAPLKQFILQAAKVIKQQDTERNGKKHATTLKAFQEAAVSAYGDSSKICPYCHRGLSFSEEAPARGHQAVLESISDDHAQDVNQRLQWVCRMCARAKDHHGEDEFLEFLKLVQKAPEKYRVVAVPKDELSTMDYYRQELLEKDGLTMTMTRPDGQPVHVIFR
ncbi:hypothetical protein BCR43DRAFT_198113 [Syncephalastrum racemosum]|uniref:Myb-like domain-containing protein n=1 Tax=Syncephalastrum racemosum TaxID=13706 RepID=A0A1X2HHK4_SYNRA|nr:hypothetical protein BCR43DRAFT_198113 [Syncephalastrum racemosum]